jgi:Methyltransferase domain
MASKNRRTWPSWKVFSFPLILAFSFAHILVKNVFLFEPLQPRSVHSGADSSLSTYELAKHESLGFFDDVDNFSWQRHKIRAQSEAIYYRPDNPNEGTSDVVSWHMNNVDPIFTCPNIRRVGGRGDGPKWTCDPHRLVKKPDCLIYSIGSFGNFVFEDGIIEILKQNSASNGDMWYSNCEIHVFDPGPSFARKDDIEVNNIHYHAWGLNSSYLPLDNTAGFPESYKFRTLQEIRGELGHMNRRIDIFKIDCEGCEHSTYLDWLDPSVDIRQILIETHGVPELASHFFDRFFDLGFVLFSKEPNNFAQPAGRLYEWAWLKLHPDFLNRSTSLIKSI